MLLWLPWSAFKAHRHARRLGYAIGNELVAVREGWWNRHWRFAEIDKLQALQLVCSPFDRRCGTATLRLDTAGAHATTPPLRIRFLPEAEARELLARLSHELRRRPLRWAGSECRDACASATMPSMSTDTPHAPLPLSGVVIAMNEADRIGRCLESMRTVCREIIVLDSGSSDDTVAVARAGGARVEHQDWLGFAGQKNAAIERATQPWLLLLDADEWLAEGSADKLRALFASDRLEQADVWRLPRRNWFLGGRLRHLEMVERLVRPGFRFLPMKVHERPDLSGLRVRDCDIVLEHNTARSLQQHRDKNARYARLWAEQKFEDGRRCSALAPWTHAVAYWLKAYLLRGALFEGRAGWLFHASHARAVIDKYRHLHRMGLGR